MDDWFGVWLSERLDEGVGLVNEPCLGGVGWGVGEVVVVEEVGGLVDGGDG